MMTNPKAQNIEITISGLSVKIPVDRPLSELIESIAAATVADGSTDFDQSQEAAAGEMEGADQEEISGNSVGTQCGNPSDDEGCGADDSPSDEEGCCGSGDLGEDQPDEEEDDILDGLITSVAIERMLLFGEITPDEAIDLRHVLCSRLFDCECDDD